MALTIDQQVRNHWHKCGASPRPGVGLDEIAATERRIGRRLPRDVASFYLGVNGAEESDSELFEAWPLSKLGSVPDVVASFQGIPDYGEIARFLPEADDYFAFADCMIWSQVLAVRLGALEKSTQVAWLSGSSYAIVAPTFADFWDIYLSNPSSVLFAVNAAIKSPAG